MFRRFDPRAAQSTHSKPIKQRALKRRRVNMGLEDLENRRLLAGDIWTGASSNLWSDNGNWFDGSAPTAGENIVFPADATNKTSVYDSGLGVSSFGTITIDGGGYDISASFAGSLTLTNGISTTYGSSISNFDIDFDPGNGTVTVGAGGTIKLGGVISGASGLAVSGAGTIQLAGSSSNTFTGTTTVAGATTLVLDKSGSTAVPGDLSISGGGTVRLAQSDQIADASAVTLGSLASFNLNNFSDAVGTLNLTAATVSTGTGTLTLGGDVTTGPSSTTTTISGRLDLGGATRTFVVADGAAGTDLVVSANISGAGAGIIKGGAASAMSMSGNNTYDGTTTVSTGGIIVANANALGSTSAGTIVSSGATLGLQGSITLAAEPITISGNGVGNLGALWSSSGSNSVTGPITLAANSFIGAESSAPMTITGQITDGAGSFSVTKVRSGTVTLAAADSYDGGTTVSAGVLSISNGGALGTGAATVSVGASLRLAGGITATNALTLSGTGVSSGGALANTSGANSLSGPITLAANSSIGSLSGNLTIDGVISDGAGSFALTKVQSGTVTLAAANTYDGGTTISGGVLAISDGSALGTGSVSISSGAELDLSNDITLSRNISFQGTGAGGNGALRSVSGNNTYSGTATVQANDTWIKVDAGQLTLSGDLTDGNNNFGADKYGEGVLLVSGSLTSTLILHAVEGDLRITGSDLSIVTLYGGTISGTGMVGVLDHAGGSSGTVDPGTGGGTAGTFTTSDGYQVGATGTTHFDIGGTTAGTTYDQIVNINSGSVDLTGSDIEVALVGGFIPAIGDVFTVIDKQNSGAVTGTFNNLAEGDTFRSGIVTYQVSYAGGNGNDVTLTAVAVTYTWTGLGGDGNWSTAANWDANHAPSGGEDLVFPASASRLSNNNDLSDKSFHSIEIDGGGYFITGNAITVTGGISSTYAAGSSTFAPDIALSATETVDVAAGGTLVLSGAISGSGFGVTKAGGGTLSYSGGGANTYSGATTVDGGTLLLAKSGTDFAIAGDLVVGNNTTPATVQYGAADQIADASAVTLNETATFDLGGFTEVVGSLDLTGATVSMTTGLLTLSNGITTHASSVAAGLASTIQGGTLDLGSNPAFALTVADDAGLAVDATITSVITDGGIAKAGSGVLALSGSNTYDGLTAVNAGAIQVEDVSALGSTVGATTVASGASVYFSGPNLSLAEAFSDVAGGGVGGNNLFQVLSGDAVISGALTLTGTISVGAANGSTFTINSPIVDTAGGAPYHDLIINNGATGRTILGSNDTGGFRGNIDVLSGFLRDSTNSALGNPSVSTTVTLENGASLEMVAFILIPANKNLVLVGTPVANQSKVIAFGVVDIIQGDIAITGGNNQSFDVALGTTLTVSGVISGSRDFDKNGPGTLILTGTNTNTGNVNVGDGTLLVDGSLATSNLVFVDGTLGGSGTVGAVTISSIGTLSPGNSPGLLNTGDLAFSDSGSTYRVELDGAAVGTGYDQANVTGTVTLAGATLSLSLGYGPAIGTTFTIINNDGSDPVGGTFNGLAEGSTIQFGVVTMKISYTGGDGNDVVLSVTDVTYTWDGGGGDNNWSTAANWVGDAAPTAGSNLVFASGAARLANTNDLASNTAFFNVAILGGGYHISGNAIDLDGSLVAAYGSGSSTLGLGIVLTGSRTIDVASGGTLEVSGAISGSAGLTKTSGGTLIFSGVNTYTGTTFLDQGLLQLNASGVSIAGDITVGGPGTAATVQELRADQISDGATVNLANAGATLDLNGFDDAIGSLSLTGGAVTTGDGVLTINSGGIATLASSQTATLAGHLGFSGPNNFFTIARGTTQSGVDFSVSAIISTYANIIKDGPGTMAFSGANTYAGGTNIDAGVLAIGNHAGAGSGVVNILGTGALDLSGGIVVANSLYVGASGAAIRNSGGTNTLGGNIALGADATIDTAASSTLVISSVLDDSGNNWGLNKTGAGTLRLDLANIYGGVTTVAAGILAIGDSGSLGTGAVVNNAEIEIFNNLLLYNDFTIDSAGTAFLVDGLTTIQGTITLLSDLAISTPGLANLYLNGVIGGNGFGITKSGAGTLGLGRANTYGGGTTINGGILQVFDGQATGTTGSVVLGDGTTLIQTATTYNLPLGGLSLGDSSILSVPLPMNATLNGPVHLAGAAHFDIAALASLRVAGPISGAFGPTQAGSGTLILLGANSYTGPTSVDGGVLQVDGDISAGGGVVVSAGSTLSGLGAAPAVTVSAGAFVSPGHSPGKLSTAGVDFATGSTFVVELTGGVAGTDYDQLDVTGTVTLASPVLALTAHFTPTGADQFTLIDNDGSDPVVGTFLGLAEGATFGADGKTFRISYVGGDGNDVVLTSYYATTTMLSSDINPTSYGQSVTFTALVTSVGTPTGDVAFYDGSTLVATAAVNDLGIATFTTNVLSAAAHSFTAVFTGTGLFLDSTSFAYGQTVNQAATTNVVTSSANPSVYGEPVVLTATIGASSANSPAPTGIVQFYQNSPSSAYLGSVSLNGSGVAIFSVPSGNLTVGAHGFYAVYLGDPNFLPNAAGNTVTQTVNLASSSTSLAPTPTSGVFGESITFTATVSAVDPGAGALTGVVSFYDGATLLGVSALSSGMASLSTSSLGVGSHPITAVYSGDPNFHGATSSTANLAIGKSSSDAVVMSSSGSTVSGQSVTFSVSVAASVPGAGIPTGMVAFFDGLVPLGTATLSSGSASLSTSGLSAGPHSITARYSGDANFKAGTSSAIAQVVGAAVTSVSISKPSTSVLGDPVTITGSVSVASPGAGSPTGFLTFLDGSTVLGTVALAGGSASLLTSSLTGGSHSLSIEYSGDASFAASTSTTSTLTVSQGASASTLSASSASAPYGRMVVLTTRVNVIPGFGMPTGTVTFFDGANAIGTASVSGASASLSVADLGVGAHAITSVYTGDERYLGSTSNPLSHSVTPAATTTIFVASSNPSVHGQAVSFTAVVSAASTSGAVPSGSVSFFDGDALLGTAALIGDRATLTAACFGAGQAHAIRAVYSGDPRYLASTSATGAQVVQKASVQGFAEFVRVNGSASRLKALVRVASPGGGVPTGEIVFRMNGRGFRRVTLVNGQASVRIPQRLRGGNTFNYRYVGDSNYNGMKASEMIIDRSVFKATARPASAFVGRPNPR